MYGELRDGVWSRVGTGWGGTGWVYRVGNTGPTDHVLGEQTLQRSGPRSPCRGRSGWQGAAGVRLLEPTLRARSACSLPGSRTLLEQVPTHGRLNPQNLRITLILLEVSQNGRVSPRNHQKACHSPCFQNGSKKSALEIPRFPILLAFSPKELMGVF